MEKSGSEKTYPSRRRACYQSVTGSGRFLIDDFNSIIYNKLKNNKRLHS
ncbi:MAG: hypothetical protein ACOCQG_00500 [Candidatus Nanoarchaeia archaeon]